MKITFIAILTIIYFLVLPANLLLTTFPPYGNFVIVGDLLFIIFWILPLVYLFVKNKLNTKSVGILIVINTIFVSTFYYMTEVKYLNLRKDYARDADNEIKKMIDKNK